MFVSKKLTHHSFLISISFLEIMEKVGKSRNICLNTNYIIFDIIKSDNYGFGKFTRDTLWERNKYESPGIYFFRFELKSTHKLAQF